jgi:hypothetical protein
MANQIQQVIDISSSRYTQYRDLQPALAQAYQAITNYARDEQKQQRNPRALLKFLTRPHSDPNLTIACKDVFRLLGTAPMA